jgi:HEAT repeat protein
MKRAFAQYRLYGIRHESSEQAELELFDVLGRCLEDRDSLTFGVEATRLLSETVAVLVDDRKEESITRPLFTDGVETITFLRGIDLEELRAYLHVWNAAITRTFDAEHTFSTLVWEMESPHVATGFRPNLAEHGVADAKAKEQASRQSAILERIMSSDPVDAPIQVDAGALAVIGDVGAFDDLDREELEARGRRERDALEGLSDTEQKAMASGLAASRRGVGQRALYGLFSVIGGADVVQRAALLDLVAKSLVMMLERDRVAEIDKAFLRIADAPDSADRASFFEALADGGVMLAVEAKLSEGHDADAIAAILRHLPDDRIEALLPVLERSKRDVRGRVARIIASKNPSAFMAAAWALEGGADRAEGLFAVVEKLGPEHADFLTRACLIHDDPAVRRRGLAGVKTEDEASFRSLIVDRLEDESDEVRQAALQILVRAKDPVAAAVLERQLADDSASADLRRASVRGLATVGGPLASRALCKVLVDSDDRELRKAAALGLSGVATPEAVSLLEEEAARLLGDRAVKEACREALRRIRARQGGSA